MRMKSFLFGLTSLLSLSFGLQPIFAEAEKCNECHKSKSSKSDKIKPVICPVVQSDKDSQEVQHFKHNIQLYLADGAGFAVPGTEFWVTLDVLKQGSWVTLQIPLINFQTVTCSSIDPFCDPFILGGYLYTSADSLPEGLRPIGLMPQTIVAGSNNGFSVPFSFFTPPPPNPPPGYLVSVTNGGDLIVQGVGAPANVIPLGPQILLPCTITYEVNEQYKICNNTKLSTGASDTTEFDTTLDFRTGYRDSHVNDAFNGRVAWAWTDNSMIADKTNNTMNVMVAVGRVTKDGKLKVKKPIQLTNLPPEVYAWDTAVAINRLNPDNIVVSYSVLNAPGTPCAAISFDGGKTWPAAYDGTNAVPLNGPINTQPTGSDGGAGDNRGVSADKYGNIWYATTNDTDGLGNPINQPYFCVSTDGGVTFEVAYTVPLLPDFILGTSIYDFSQYCFGGLGDGSGTYGLWYAADYVYDGADITPVVGFIPIYGLGSYGAGSVFEFDPATSSDTQYLPCITASQDGRVWIESMAASAGSFISPVLLRFKSPANGGGIGDNWAGPWNIGTINGASEDGVTNQIAFSLDQGNFQSIQDAIYDDARQALYVLVTTQVPYFSQNMNVYLVISRDNGQTWSDPLIVNSSSFANRGFPTMALDPVKGNLVFGWYDGRKDKTFKSLNYYSAILPANTLDQLVNQIPLSNPLFVLP